MVKLDLGNWIAHSLGRRQACLAAVSIAVVMAETERTDCEHLKSESDDERI